MAKAKSAQGLLHLQQTFPDRSFGCIFMRSGVLVSRQHVARGTATNACNQIRNETSEYRSAFEHSRCNLSAGHCCVTSLLKGCCILGIEKT